MSITYYDTLIDESKLKPIRQALYHSQGPGYYVFPQYITKEFTEHIVEFWTKEIVDKHEKTHKPFKSKNHFLYNCPNFVGFSGPKSDNVTYYNFFWNAPPEQVTYGVSFQIQILRNLIEASPIFNEIFPLDGISATFRVVNTKNGEMLVPPHTDWDGIDGKPFDPKRLQATLFLSKKGIDYSGTGFMLKNNQGKYVVFDGDVEINPGDLVLWRYNNEHQVKDISSSKEQLGFLRILYPQNVGALTFRKRTKEFIKRNILKRYPVISKILKR